MKPPLTASHVKAWAKLVTFFKAIKATIRTAIVNQLTLGLATVLGITFLWPSCSLERPPLRQIRGHTESFQGIAHGKFAIKGMRYCTKCHGETLQGGENGEFSCFKCHGQKWQETDGSVRYAPESHTVQQGGKWFHHPGGTEAKTNCTSCHGLDLTGASGPSCLLCHEQKWSD